ncbi:MAG: Ig-like domain-containing protein [Planctomycetota bacterium]|jgi:hypothetical protein
MPRHILCLAVLIVALAVACGGGSTARTPTPASFEITDVIPASGTDNVPMFTGITVVFSGPVDEATLDRDTFSVIADNGKEIFGVREVGRLTPNLVTFTPWEGFVSGAEHTIRISTGVRTTTGLALQAPVESVFTAEEELPDLPQQFLIADLRDTLRGGRWFHRATLLPDNRIAVIGGYGSTGAVQTRVEVLDPSTEQSTIQAAALLNARAAHVQVLLDNGLLLIAGGEASDFPFNPHQSAELWDFQTATSTAAAPMNFRRSFAEALKLADGRVLVTGGQSLDGTGQFIFRDDAEIYDPVSDSWTLIPGPASRGRSGHGNWLLSDGRILLLGGTSSAPSADILDLTTGVFTPPASFAPVPHIFGAYATLLNGRAMYAGGSGSKSITLYDEQFGFLTALNEMVNERAFGTATTMPNGRVVLAGGTDFSRSPALLQTTIDLFVPEQGSGRVYRVPNFRLPTPTTHHAAVLDAIGDLWLIGGLPTDAALPGRRQVTRIRFSLQ